MSLNAINNNALNQLNINMSDMSKMGSAAQEAKTAAVENKVSESSALRVDQFVKSKDSSSDTTGIYSKKSLVEQLKADEEQRVSALKKMISDAIGDQSFAFNISSKNGKALEEIRAKAKEAISDGGEYSVDSVTDRIMQMAKALAGGDPSKIDKLQNAVIKGFEKAAGVMGKKSLDEMPDITKKTYESVMNQFSDWKKSAETQDTNSQNASAAQKILAQTAKKAPENNVAAQTEAASAAALSA